MTREAMTNVARRGFDKQRNYAELHNIRNNHLNKIARIALAFHSYSSAHNWYIKLNEAALRLVEIESSYIALAEQAKEDGTFDNKKEIK